MTDRLRDALKAAGLTQREFGHLGGWTPGHVNRWCRQERSDRRDVPRYAWALLLAYSRLSARERAALWVELEKVDG